MSHALRRVVAAAARAALLGALALPASAQVRVKVQGRAKPSDLELQVQKLGQDGSRAAAMAALAAAGRPAVPLLVKAAQNDDALSLPALRVLAALGGEARSATPALEHLAAGSTPLAGAAAHALAAIGTHDSVLVADWAGNRIVELDGQGRQLRRVEVKAPWCVVPVAGDRLLVCCPGDQAVKEVDWQGAEVAKWEATRPIWAHRLVDGTTWVSEYGAKRIARFDQGGKVQATLPLQARMLRVLWNDHLLVLDHVDNRLREVAPDGTVVREHAVAANAMTFDVTTDARIRILYHDRLTEIDDAGKEQPVDTPAFTAGYALACQRDGSQFLGGGTGLELRDARGELVWRAEGRGIACIVPRLDLPGRR